MSFAILVPIKTNNKRLPGKTFLNLGEKPLYAHLFSKLKILNNSFAKVYIDSSDEKILDLAQTYGFNFFKRPEEFNSDTTTGDELISRVIDDLEGEIIGLLHITSPFLKEETIRNFFIKLNNLPELDSIFGVKEIYNRCWFEGKPINHNPQKLVRTQDLSPIEVESADAYFFRKSSFKKFGKRVCGNFKSLPVSDIECTDIDNFSDLIYAEALLKAGLIKD